jgi:UDP-N-acetylglucosamine transferase subunit ALG13
LTGVAKGFRSATVCLAASPGGHIAELVSARQAFDGFRRVWVTGRSRQADALRGEGEMVALLPPWGRDPPGPRGFPPNLAASRKLVAEHRPGVVVTNGAGLAVPFALLARARGSRLIVAETMARVTDLSLSTRILAPFANALLVQWPEAAGGRRRAIVCRPALLEAQQGRSDAGEGTFVSVGTRPEPFDRLLAAVDRAVGAGRLPGPVTAQSGSSSYRPASYDATAWMTPEEIERALRSARYVVCHAGTGMVAAALASGHRPLVMARRRADGEHRTEHQGQIVDRLSAAGAVVRLEAEIGEAEVERAGTRPSARATAHPGPSLAAALRAELVKALGEPRSG